MDDGERMLGYVATRDDEEATGDVTVACLSVVKAIQIVCV